MISLVEITGEKFHRYEAGILEIERASFPSPWTSHLFRQEISRRGSHLWAFTVYDDIAGYICFRLLSVEIHLMNMAVHPSRRGSGLGLELLTRMINRGMSHGAKTAWLEVRPSNRIARRLYEKAGFKEIDRKPQYYTDTKEDAIVMSLPLVQRNVFHKVASLGSFIGPRERLSRDDGRRTAT